MFATIHRLLFAMAFRFSQNQASRPLPKRAPNTSLWDLPSSLDFGRTSVFAFANDLTTDQRMSLTRNRRILQLFEQSIDLPVERRDAFLADSCDDDAQMRAEIEALLATQEQANEFLPVPQQIDNSTGVHVSDDTDVQRSQIGESRLSQEMFLAERYRILDTLGAGGMGEVYRAVDTRLDRNVAIKVLNRTGQRSTEVQRRFDREMKSVAALSHPNVVTLHDIGEHDNMQFAVMELVEGKTLRQLIAEGLQWETATSITHGIAMGLSAAHAQEIMHRDIKPENVIVSEDGLVKILDFGIARQETTLADQNLTGELVPGTIPYMSPEQAAGRELTCATDIFSLGTMLFEMLAGVNPFRAETALETLRNVGDAAPSSLTSFVADVPSGAIALVESMLRRNPAQRPSASEISEYCTSINETSTSASVVSSVPTNVSLRPIDLTGRAREIEEIVSRLKDHPIVTIAGTGGVGKTSVATEVARRVLPQYPGGVWLCELAPVRDPNDVVEVLASVLDGNAGSMSGLEQIVGRLDGQPTALVFDNCEHVVDSVADLAAALSSRLPVLTILTTSRESLNVAGEYVIRLDGLDCTGTASDAANLFVRRAASLTGFQDEPARRGLVEQIVTRLDGLPLAIELAAPRLAAMSLEELLDALSDQLSALRTGRRSQGRQATLEQAINWSFDLLAPDEQKMLLSLSVFAASFTADAAVEVCGCNAGGKMLLQRLVEQSVVVRTERNGLSRYRLLEPIRQYCHAKFDAESATTARQRHAHYNARRASDLGLGISGHNEIDAAEALNAEWPDLRQAVAWGRQNRIAEIAVDPIVALARTIMFQLRTEAYQWIIEAEQLFGDEITSRADVNWVIGNGFWVMGDPEKAELYLDRADAIELTPQSLLQRYFLRFSQKRFLESSDVFDQARELALQSGDEIESRWTALPLGTCPLTMADPHNPRIDVSLSASETYVSTLDWPTGKAWQALASGTVAMTRRQMEAAMEFRNEAIELAASCGNRWIELIARLVVSDAADPKTPPPARLGSALMNLQSLIDAGEETHYPLAARNIVIALVACGHLESGVRCSSTAEAFVGVGDKDEFTPLYPATIAQARAGLGEPRFEQLRQEGQGLSVLRIAEIAQQSLAEL